MQITPRRRGRRFDAPVAATTLVIAAALVAVPLVGPAAVLGLTAVAIVSVFLVRTLPEAFLALLLVSGPLSSTALADAVPIGLTTIALAGTLAAVAHQGWRRRHEVVTVPRTVVFFALLAALLFAAAFHSPDPAGGLDKSLTFATITAVAFLAPLVIIDSRRSVVRFAVLVAAIGVLVGLSAVQTGHDSHPLVLPGSDSEIVVGEYAGLGLLAIVTLLWPITPGLWRLAWVVPAGLVVPTLVGAGSRGALLGTLVGLVFGLAFLIRRRDTRLPALAVLAAIVVAAPAVWASSPPAAQAKYLATLRVDQTSEALDAGGGARGEILEAAADLFSAHPMGVGTGGYPALTGYVWPHNVVLELGAETGVVGVALLLALLVSAAIHVAPGLRRGSIEVIGACSMYAATLVLALSSFDLNNNRAMWLMLGVALAAGTATRSSASRPAPPPPPPRIAAQVALPAATRSRGRRRRALPVAPGRASAAAGGAESLAFRGVEAGLGVVLVILTARFMAPEGRGLFALASLCALLCTLPLGSVWSASAIEVARRRVPLPALAGALTGIALLGGLITGAVATALIPIVDQPFWVIAFPAALAPLLLIARYQEGIAQSLGDIRAVNLMHAARAALPVAFMAAPLVAGVSDRTAIALWAASLSLLPLIFVGSTLRLTGGIARPRDGALVRRLLRGGGQLVVANSAVLVNTRLSLLFLAAFATTAAVGVYSVAIAAAEVVYLASFALMSATFHAIGAGERSESLRVTARALRHAVLLHAAGCALLVPVMLVALPAIVGPGYDDVPWLLAIMAPGLIGQAGFWVLHTYFTVQLARPPLIVRVAVSALAVNVVLASALVPVIGIWGAAVASSVANLVSGAVMMRVFVKVSGTPIAALVPRAAELRDYGTLAQGIVGSARARVAPGRPVAR